MICDRCGCEKFRTTDVYRNRVFSIEKNEWLFTQNKDTRKVLCCDCHTVYLTVTEKQVVLNYNNETCKTNYVLPHIIAKEAGNALF